MTTFNANNERIKREYFEWEREANGKSEQTITNVRAAIYLFEHFTKFQDFRSLHKETIITFKKDLTKKINKNTGKPVSQTYLLHTSTYLINFFKWLTSQQAYKRKIKSTNIAYFNLSDKDMQIAHSCKNKKIPTINQIESVVRAMPADNEIQKRNRALISFLILTGIRVSAITSLKLKHVILAEGYVEQNPDEVKTKFGKKITTYFFPAGDFLKEVFIEWYHFLLEEKNYDYDAPLFPRTMLSLDQNDQFKGENLDNRPWQSTTPIREIVKEAFHLAGFSYYNPHSFRDTLVRLAYERCKTPEDLKAWSQNLGHSSPLTTLTSYGAIETYNQGEIIKRLGVNKAEDNSSLKSLEKKIDLLLMQNHA